MGTTGFAVYRYKNRYFCASQGSDSYPSGLGLDLWQTIPCAKENRADFEEWLQGVRGVFEGLISNSSPVDREEDEKEPEDDFRNVSTAVPSYVPLTQFSRSEYNLP